MASLMELQGAMGAVQGGAEETADQNATASMPTTGSSKCRSRSSRASQKTI